MTGDDLPRQTTVERFDGLDARFGTAPGEIYLVLQTGRPAYVRLRPGKYLQEGDSFHREQLGLSSPTLATWAVTEITDDEVVGEAADTGEPVKWDRDHVERGLAIGEYSTNLTDFEAVSVIQTGRWEDYDRDSDERRYRYSDRPYVTAIAYGDNGLKYGRRYEFVDEARTELELWTQDEAIERFDEPVADQFDRQVRAALESDGYAVREPDE